MSNTLKGLKAIKRSELGLLGEKGSQLWNCSLKLLFRTETFKRAVPPLRQLSCDLQFVAIVGQKETSNIADKMILFTALTRTGSNWFDLGEGHLALTCFGRAHTLWEELSPEWSTFDRQDRDDIERGLLAYDQCLWEHKPASFLRTSLRLLQQLCAHSATSPPNLGLLTYNHAVACSHQSNWQMMRDYSLLSITELRRPNSGLAPEKLARTLRLTATASMHLMQLEEAEEAAKEALQLDQCIASEELLLSIWSLQTDRTEQIQALLRDKAAALWKRNLEPTSAEDDPTFLGYPTADIVQKIETLMQWAVQYASTAFADWCCEQAAQAYPLAEAHWRDFMFRQLLPVSISGAEPSHLSPAALLAHWQRANQVMEAMQSSLPKEEEVVAVVEENEERQDNHYAQPWNCRVRFNFSKALWQVALWLQPQQERSSECRQWFSLCRESLPEKGADEHMQLWRNKCLWNIVKCYQMEEQHTEALHLLTACEGEVVEDPSSYSMSIYLTIRSQAALKNWNEIEQSIPKLLKSMRGDSGNGALWVEATLRLLLKAGATTITLPLFEAFLAEGRINSDPVLSSMGSRFLPMCVAFGKVYLTSTTTETLPAQVKTIRSLFEASLATARHTWTDIPWTNTPAIWHSCETLHSSAQAEDLRDADGKIQQRLAEIFLHLTRRLLEQVSESCIDGEDDTLIETQIPALAQQMLLLSCRFHFQKLHLQEEEQEWVSSPFLLHALLHLGMIFKLWRPRHDKGSLNLPLIQATRQTIHQMQRSGSECAQDHQTRLTCLELSQFDGQEEELLGKWWDEYLQGESRISASCCCDYWEVVYSRSRYRLKKEAAAVTDTISQRWLIRAMQIASAQAEWDTYARALRLRVQALHERGLEVLQEGLGISSSGEILNCIKNFPKLEQEWLQAHTWNLGVFHYRQAGWSAAEKWMHLAMSIASTTGNEYHSREMLNIYSRVVSRMPVALTADVQLV